MATVTLSNGAKYLKVTYTASNGKVTITELSGYSGDGYRSYDKSKTSVTVAVAGSAKSVSFSHYIDFPTSGYQAWSATDTSWTGLTGTSIAIKVTLPSMGTSLSGKTFSGTLAMSWSKYTISYNANGGSGAPSAQTKTYGTALTLSTTKPTRSGHTFKNWNTNSGGTGTSYASGGTYSANASATLYAQWAMENAESSIIVNNSATLGGNISLSFDKMVSTNYHTIKMTSGSNSYAYSGTYSDSATLSLPEKTFANWFSNDSNELDITITATTYNSSGTSVGTSTATFTLIMPESIGAPEGKVKAVITTKTPLEATINLSQNLQYKYGASFNGWHIICNSGSFVIEDNIVTFIRPSEENKTAVVYARAIDSRGFMSEMISIYCYVRRKGFCVYDSINGGWKQVSPYIFDGFKYKRLNGSMYFDGEWRNLQGVVTVLPDDNPPESDGLYLTDESGNILTDENGNYLLFE